MHTSTNTWRIHYNDVIMSAMASQITRLTMFTQPFIQGQIKETSKLCIIGLCAGNSQVTGEFPTQKASNAEYVSIWWRHHSVHILQIMLPCCSQLSNINDMNMTNWLPDLWPKNLNHLCRSFLAVLCRFHGSYDWFQVADRASYHDVWHAQPCSKVPRSRPLGNLAVCFFYLSQS